MTTTPAIAKLAMLAGILVPAVGLGVWWTAPAPAIKPKPTFRHSGQPLTGKPMADSQPQLEIRSFALGSCVVPAAAARLIAREAAQAARVAQQGYGAIVGFGGGADATPITRLRGDCHTLAPAGPDMNRRLARARAARVKQMFLREFRKAGANPARLEWAERAPVVSGNVDRPGDRYAAVELRWNADPQPDTDKRASDLSARERKHRK